MDEHKQRGEQPEPEPQGPRKWERMLMEWLFFALTILTVIKILAEACAGTTEFVARIHGF